MRTTADGTARFLPGAVRRRRRLVRRSPPDRPPARLRPVAPLPSRGRRAGGLGSRALDILFLLDATGSMGDEIDRLKATIDNVAAARGCVRVPARHQAGDDLVPRRGRPFVDVDVRLHSRHRRLPRRAQRCVADGGGDYPEALEEGLADALGSPRGATRPHRATRVPRRRRPAAARPPGARRYSRR